jgi:hypothetical protein
MGVIVPGGGLSGATIDFLLSAKRDAATAQRFLTKALGGEPASISVRFGALGVRSPATRRFI